jgi:hypothetical protein
MSNGEQVTRVISLNDLDGCLSVARFSKATRVASRFGCW